MFSTYLDSSELLSPELTLFMLLLMTGLRSSSMKTSRQSSLKNGLLLEMFTRTFLPKPLPWRKINSIQSWSSILKGPEETSSELESKLRTKLLPPLILRRTCLQWRDLASLKILLCYRMQVLFWTLLLVLLIRQAMEVPSSFWSTALSMIISLKLQRLLGKWQRISWETRSMEEIGNQTVSLLLEQVLIQKETLLFQEVNIQGTNSI